MDAPGRHPSGRRARTLVDEALQSAMFGASVETMMSARAFRSLLSRRSASAQVLAVGSMAVGLCAMPRAGQVSPIVLLLAQVADNQIALLLHQQISSHATQWRAAFGRAIHGAHAATNVVKAHTPDKFSV
jgi:hypothetical protein